MDANRFDSITRLFADRKTRRAALKGGGIGLAAAAMAPLAGRVAAQDATPAAAGGDSAHPEAAPSVTELFTQAFASGTWEQGSGDTYTLTLTGTPAHTIYFSDRPERLFGLTPMQEFVTTIDSEPSDPPNAALVTQDPDSGDEDILLVVLENPQYDASSSTLTYDAKVLTDYQEGNLSSAAIQQQDYDFPATFGHGGLFIDGYCKGKYSVSCTLKSDGSAVGDANNLGCCWKGFGCKHCHNTGDDCADAYPSQCRDSDGNNLCNGEATGSC